MRTRPSVFSGREFSRAGELEDLLQAEWQKRILADSSLQRVTSPHDFCDPFGTLCMNRPPLGMCCASELCQRTVSEILADVEGATRHMDDDVKQK